MKVSSPKLPVGIGLGGLTAGAALVYWLDPERGAKRRAQVKQKAVHALKETNEAAGVMARDIAHRGRGLLAEARARLAEVGALFRGEAEDDVIVEERVRARLGRRCSHPGSIEVKSKEGRVELKGPILKAELHHVLRGVAKVRGVREIHNALEPHQAEDIAALQGGAGRAVERPELLQEHWSPAARVIVGSAGIGLLAWGAYRRSLARWGLGGAGGGLLLRSLTNLPTKRLIGVGAGRRAIDLHKDIHVNTQPEEVFAFFSRFENFPKFMSHVREVLPQGEGRWRWSTTGPANIPVAWSAELTQLIPNQVIAWKSVEGAAIRSEGIIRFEPDRGGTRIDIRMSYNPPAGAIGHAFAALFGANPKKLLDDDMLRFKSLVEAGKATGREETVTRQELSPERTRH